MYSLLLQKIGKKGDKALGVLKKKFKTISSMDDHMAKHFPTGHFHSSDFTTSDRAKGWLKKYGTYTPKKSGQDSAHLGQHGLRGGHAGFGK